MPTAHWKKIELEIARRFGGERRGADFGDRQGGKNDVIHPYFSIEVKHGRKLGFQLMRDAVDQAVAAAGEWQIPLAVIHRHGDSISRSLVVMDLDEFVDWYVSLQGDD